MPPKDPMVTGGPAFPSSTSNSNQDGQLSVRDYFAAQAMAALLSQADFQDTAVELIAIWAYDYADAMLVRREGK